MKKKMLVMVLAALLILPAYVFAVDLIGLRVGPAFITNETVDLTAEDLVDQIKAQLSPDKLSYGADVRLNLSVIEANVLALISQGIDDQGDVVPGVWNIDAYANAGLGISLLNFVRLGVSAGPKIEVNFADGEASTSLDDAEIDPLALDLNLRLTADVMLGDFSIGGSLIMETGKNFTEIADDPEFFKTLLDTPSAKLGVSAMIALF